MTACFDEGTNYNAISADEWQETFSGDNFSCWATTNYTTINYDYCDGEIQVDIYESGSKEYYYYVKNDDSSLTSYKTTTKTDEGWSDLTDITAADYNGKCAAIIDFMAYLKSNYNEFTFSDTDYVLNQSGLDSVKSNVAQIVNIFNLERDEIRFDLQKVQIYKQRVSLGSQKYNEYTVRLVDDNDDIRLSITVKDVASKIAMYKYDYAFANLNNYTVELLDDSSRSCYDVIEDGIRVSSTFYEPVSTSEVFYYHDMQNDDYYYYYKNEKGNFEKVLLTGKAMYESALNVLYLEAFPFADHYDWLNGTKTRLTGSGNYVRGSTTYYFNDVVLNFDDDGNITGGTWKVYFTIGSVSSVVSNVTLTTGNTTIAYPPVE